MQTEKIRESVPIGCVQEIMDYIFHGRFRGNSPENVWRNQNYPGWGFWDFLFYSIHLKMWTVDIPLAYIKKVMEKWFKTRVEHIKKKLILTDKDMTLTIQFGRVYEKTLIGGYYHVTIILETEVPDIRAATWKSIKKWVN